MADQQSKLARERKDTDKRIARLVAAIETGGDVPSLGSGITQPPILQTYNGGVLGFKVTDQRWNFGSPNFNNFGAPTAAVLNSLFLNGPYTFTVQGASVTLNLADPVAPLGPPPMFTLTGGTWVGGKYVVDVNDTVTITSTPFTNFGGNVDGVVNFSIQGIVSQSASYSQNPGANTINYTLNGSALVSGTDYQAYGAFLAIVDKSTGVPLVPSSSNDAFFQTETGFIISAVGTSDTTPPVISSLTTSAPRLWPPNHKMVRVAVTAAATDNVSSVSTRIVSVTSNEPDNGLGDGDTEGDVEIIGPMTVNLRAERSGRGSGRIYTITVEASDEAGNTTTREVQVLVPHNGR